MGKEQNNAVPTVEGLQKKVAELQAAAAAGQKEKDDLTAIAEDLEKQLAAAKEENEMLKSVNDELSNEVATLSEKNLQQVVNDAQQKQTKLSTETFTVAGKKYGFAYPVMMYKGKRITNDDVFGSKELQEELVNAGSTMIKAIQ